MAAKSPDAPSGASSARTKTHQRSFPAVLAGELRASLLDYLRSTFKLQNTELEAALFRFLEDPEAGLFRGPYLDVRLPFVKSPDGWREHLPLGYAPPRRPYAHQLQAFERLGSLGQAPRPTIITTGTGSGKTECFLYPLLDHCLRARQRGERGIKALVLYPMNALASDQAARFAAELAKPELAGVSAGLYVGGKGRQAVKSPLALIDDRNVLRQSPPDILLTNYKMLDLLLMRPADARLWEHARLSYLVLDELHTYDGAQGSDVACLIRRLKARLGMERGQLCPVGTSATLGSSGSADPRAMLLQFASQVFGEDFEPDAIIEETRCERQHVLRAPSAEASTEERDGGPRERDASLPFEQLLALACEGKANPADPAPYESPPAYIAAQAMLWGGLAARMPTVLADDLREHRFSSSLLRALTAKDRRRGPMLWSEVLRGLSEEYPELGPLPPEVAWHEYPSRGKLPPDWQWNVLSSFLSLISQARTSEGQHEQPFLHVEVQLWVRELRGLVRQVTPRGTRLAWADELGPAEEGEHWAQLLYCRECGSDAWAATQGVADTRLRVPRDVGRAFLDGDSSARVVAIRSLAAQVQPSNDVAAFTHVAPSNDAAWPHPDEEAAAKGGAEPPQQRLCSACLRLHGSKGCACGAAPEVALRVQVYESTPKWPLHRCPDCHARNGLTFLASRVSTLSSVALSRWYASELNPEPKLLAFTDSVQDASHRAGFFGGRAHRFSLRTALQSALEQKPDGTLPLPAMAHAVRSHWEKQLGPAHAVAALLPPDLREDPDVWGYRRQGKLDRVPPGVWAALEERLGFDALFELSLGVNQGRSLEATGCATLSVDPERLARAASTLASSVREELLVPHLAPGADVEALAWRYLDGLVQRLRRQCGVLHPWLLGYARSGDAFMLGRRHNPRIAHFPMGSPLPVFWHLSAQHDQHDAVLASTATWYQDFFQRVFASARDTASGVRLAQRAVRCLSDVGLIGPVPKAELVRGLTLEGLLFSREVGGLQCTECRRQRQVPLPELARVEGTPCDRFRCPGAYQRVPVASGRGYYQALYKSGRLARIHAAEHTGLLERHTREDLEKRFKGASEPDAPNLLACTPTLEMGIDIGDLSNVMLCSVPPSPANYLQRIGRAGRKSGNALVLTWANQRPHDMYFFAQPEEMLRGRVAPPGCFLDAPEMLARQMLAHGFDQWAMAAPANALPSQMRHVSLDKPGSFPQDFVDFYRRQQKRLTEEFLELFALEMSTDNAKRLRASAGTVLTRALDALEAAKEAAKHYRGQILSLEKQIEQIDNDPDKASVELRGGESLSEGAEREKRELNELKAAYTRLRLATSQRYPLNVLTDAGVLPNYAFPEPGVTLSALLRENKTVDSAPKGGAGKAARKGREARVEYVRPASQALREFAPFNTFYAEGHKIKVSQLDLGTKGDALETWVLCATCHHAARKLGGAPPAAACPQCGDVRWADAGQEFTLLQFRRALSVVNRSEAATRDDSEDRQMSQYRTERFIDVRAEHYQGAFLVQSDSLVFGYELLRDLELRELNFGPAADTRGHRQVAGLQVRQQGFLTCLRCGKVAQKEDKFEHAATCGVRTQNWSSKLGRVLLYRSVRSEAIRVLLPVSLHEVERIAHTLRAALLLGFRLKFKGQPLHLQVSTADESRGGKKRRFLVIYDTVPGGTGYLAELWKTGGFVEVLERALDALQTCSYCLTHGRDGCYRCIFAYQEQRHLPDISRQTAIALLGKVVAARGALKQTTTLSDASMDQVLESELEERFVSALEKVSTKNGWSWQTVPRGGKPCYALETPHAQWWIEPQRELGPLDGVSVQCRPDFVATCTSNPDLRQIAIFCDGLEFHVCPGAPSSRLGDDVFKRQALLDSGHFWVWGITWKDLDQALGVASGGPTTLFADVQVSQSELLLKAAGIQAPVALRNQNNFGLLEAFLKEPEAAALRRVCLALGVGALRLRPPFSQTAIERKRLRLRTREKLSDRPISHAPAPEARLAGFERRDHAALLGEIPTHTLQGAITDDTAFRWTLRLFDAPEERRSPSFEESWRAFLHAWNLLQFNAQLPEVLSSELLQQEGEELEKASVAPRGARTEAPRPGAPISPEQRPALSALRASGLAGAVARSSLPPADARFFSEFAEYAALGDALLREGLPLPVDVGELDATLPPELDALLCWPERKVALCVALSEREASAWQTHGWAAFDVAAEPSVIITALKARVASKGSPRKAAARGAPPPAAETPGRSPSRPPAPRTAKSRK